MHNFRAIISTIRGRHYFISGDCGVATYRGARERTPLQPPLRFMQIRRVYLFSSGGGVDEKTLKSSI